MFFFEKKNQKTFDYGVGLRGGGGFSRHLLLGSGDFC
jgi:hypothetical protein